MSRDLNKPVESSVRKPVKSSDLMLEILEAMHAVLLRYEEMNDQPDADISALNNDVRSRLETLRSRGGLFSEQGDRK